MIAFLFPVCFSFQHHSHPPFQFILIMAQLGATNGVRAHAARVWAVSVFPISCSNGPVMAAPAVRHPDLTMPWGHDPWALLVCLQPKGVDGRQLKAVLDYLTASGETYTAKMRQKESQNKSPNALCNVMAL